MDTGVPLPLHALAANIPASEGVLWYQYRRYKRLPGYRREGGAGEQRKAWRTSSGLLKAPLVVRWYR